MDLFDLSGQTAFVTGAGSGIGQRIAVGLAEAGADVACFDLPGHAQMGDTIARIRALARRPKSLEPEVAHIADLEVDFGSHQAQRGGKTIMRALAFIGYRCITS